MTTPKEPNGLERYTRLSESEQKAMTEEFFAFLDHHPRKPFSFVSISTFFKVYAPVVALLIVTVINRNLFTDTQTLDTPVITDSTAKQENVENRVVAESSNSSNSQPTEVQAATAKQPGTIQKSSSSASVGSARVQSIRSVATSKSSNAVFSSTSSVKDELADIHLTRTNNSTVHIIISRPAPVADTSEKRAGSVSTFTENTASQSSFASANNTEPKLATNDGTSFDQGVSNVVETPDLISSPVIQSRTPAPGAKNIPLAPPNAMLTFTTDVEVHASYIEVRLASGELAQRFAVAAHTLTAGSPLSIPLVAPLLANTTYYIFVPPEMINGFGGIAAMQWSFTTKAESSSSSAATMEEL